jgi:molybdate transport system substrate-binding protein
MPEANSSSGTDGLTKLGGRAGNEKTMSGIKVLSTIGMRTVLEEVTPAFERAHGVTVTRIYDSSIALMKRIDMGESGDAAVFTAAAIDELIAQGKVVGRIDLSRSFVGIAVRKGAPQPDITTPEKFRQVMLAAKSIARSKTGASGLYFANLIDRLGLADALNPKMIVEDGIVGRIAARGEAEIAVQQVSELMQADGIDIVGPLPDELQSVTVFSAGVFKNAAAGVLANAYVAHLAAPQFAAVIRLKGMEPA